MNWNEALEALVKQTKHERFRELCADDHWEHEAWRSKVVEMVTGESPHEEVFRKLETARQAWESLPAEKRKGCCK